MGELNWSAQQQLRKLERAATAAQGACYKIAQPLLRGPVMRGPTRSLNLLGAVSLNPPWHRLKDRHETRLATVQCVALLEALDPLERVALRDKGRHCGIDQGMVHERRTVRAKQTAKPKRSHPKLHP